MAERDDILISVAERHATSMLTGRKTVELRRRPVRVASGTRVWIYSKLPRGLVEAVGIIDRVVESSPSKIWDAFGCQTGISRAEFDEYFAGSQTANAIVFGKIQPLNPALSLEEIRNRSLGFHPPQFFTKLSKDAALLTFLYTALAPQT